MPKQGSTGTHSDVDLHCGDVLDVLKTLSAETVHCCITSPPYYRLRDYGVDGQIGLEQTPREYIKRLVSVFREVRRVLTVDGTLWVNIGDSYAKRELAGIPWMLAFALKEDGWYLRQDIIWHKPNPMPESVTDRCTKAHEYVFLLAKSPKYYYNAEAIREPNQTRPHGHGASKQATQCGAIRNGASDAAFREPKRIWGAKGGRNKRSVWTITPKPVKDAHFATFPPELPETCLLAASPEGGVVLDPFSGAATTGIVAVKNGRSYVGIELNPEYVEISQRRFERELGLEVDVKYFKAPEQLNSGRTVESSCDCVIGVNGTNVVNVDAELRYVEFRERMLALAATELAA